MKINGIHFFLGACLIYCVAGVLDHEGDNRSLLSTQQNRRLQRLWWNWNFCTSAFMTEDFTPMNLFVPEGIVFLAGFPSFGPEVDGEPTCTDPPTRTGTISAGKQTVFFPVYNSVTAYDINDDHKLGRPGCGTSKQEATYQRFTRAYFNHMLMNDPVFSALLFAKFDGEPLTTFYLIEDAVPKLMQCPDERTTKNYEILSNNPGGEFCDAKAFSKWGGLDYGPMHGWWGSVTREWVKGSVHTFEFGGTPAIYEYNGQRVSTLCVNVKYVLTVV